MRECVRVCICMSQWLSQQPAHCCQECCPMSPLWFHWGLLGEARHWMDCSPFLWQTIYCLSICPLPFYYHFLFFFFPIHTADNSSVFFFYYYLCVCLSFSVVGSSICNRYVQCWPHFISSFWPDDDGVKEKKMQRKVNAAHPEGNMKVCQVAQSNNRWNIWL